MISNYTSLVTFDNNTEWSEDWNIKKRRVSGAIYWEPICVRNDTVKERESRVDGMSENPGGGQVVMGWV